LNRAATGVVRTPKWLTRALSSLKREAGLAIVFCLSASVAVRAQAPTNGVPGESSQPPAESLSLTEAQRAAFERNWDLLAAKSGIGLATAQLIVAKEFPNPTANWTTFKVGSRQAATPLGNTLWDRNYDSLATVSQLIEIAGKRHDRQMAARAGIQGAKARFYDAKRTLDQGVTKAYIAALLAQENVLVLNQSAGYLRHEAQIAEVRFKAGDISESDEKQIEINADQFELQAKAAEATAVQARIGVEVLMGLTHPKGAWRPVESLDNLAGLLAPPPAETKPNAARPDVLAAEADLRGGLANLKLQKALRIPDPTFSLGYEHEPPGGGPPVDTFNLGVSFPLPLWNRNGGNIKAAQASLQQFEFALGKVRTQAKADVANAEVEYGEADSRLHRYQEQIRPKATQVRESVAFAYEKGGASLVDLLDAERTDNDVRLAAAQALSDTASAVADLKAARTVLSEAELNSNK